MAYNVPSYDTKNYSFGPGILYVDPFGDYPGTAPTTDVGAVRSGAELAITRERLEVFQGSPRQLTKQYVTSESVQLTVTGIEWNLKSLALALAQPETESSETNWSQDSGTYAAGTIFFGGSMNLTEVAVKFVHRIPQGATIQINIWRAQGTGEVTTTFGDDVHEFPYTFRALDPSSGGAASNWDNNYKLPATGSLVQITKVI